jgi:hypothetical protein
MVAARSVDHSISLLLLCIWIACLELVGEYNHILSTWPRFTTFFSEEFQRHFGPILRARLLSRYRKRDQKKTSTIVT